MVSRSPEDDPEESGKTTKKLDPSEVAETPSPDIDKDAAADLARKLAEEEMTDPLREIRQKDGLDGHGEFTVEMPAQSVRPGQEPFVAVKDEGQKPDTDLEAGDMSVNPFDSVSGQWITLHQLLSLSENRDSGRSSAVEAGPKRVLDVRIVEILIVAADIIREKQPSSLIVLDVPAILEAVPTWARSELSFETGLIVRSLVAGRAAVETALGNNSNADDRKSPHGTADNRDRLKSLRQNSNIFSLHLDNIYLPPDVTAALASYYRSIGSNDLDGDNADYFLFSMITKSPDCGYSFGTTDTRLFDLAFKAFQETFRGGSDREPTRSERNLIESIRRSHERLLGSASRSRAEMASDTPKGLLDDDPLGRAPDALAMAELICHRDAPLPLAIGLFGAWGSGKSTFMEMLEAAIDKTADYGGTVTEKISVEREGETVEEDRPAFVENVVHIRFNAWHYADANLWASIGSHIFEELQRQSRERAVGGGERDWLKELQLDELIQRLMTAQQVVETSAENLADIDDKDRKLRQSLVDVETEIAEKKKALDQAAGAALTQIVSAGVKGKLDIILKYLGDGDQALSIDSIEKLYSDTRGTVGWLRAFGRSLVSTPLWTLGLLTLGLLAYVALAWWLESTGSAHLEDIKSTIAGWAGILTALFATVGKFANRLKPLNEAHEKIADATANDLARAREQEVTLRAELEELEVRRKETKEARNAAIQEVAHLEALRRGDKPGQLLNHYIAHRADAKDYRRLLGLVSALSRDFKRMSDLMAEQRVRRLAGKDPDKKIPEIDRIILYIDDLDRCPPETVVKVLEAVHLLLAYPLFVVVVGVDPRWLETALLRVYPQQLGADGTASVWDFLEKIFQIPYHLLPPSTEPAETTSDPGYERFIDRLVGGTVAVDGGGSGGGGDGTSGGDGEDSLTGGNGNDTLVGEDGLAPIYELTPVDPPDLPEDGDDANAARILERVTLTGHELDALKALGPLIGQSPRTTKRVVNLYRLIRSRWAEERDLRELIGPTVPPTAYASVMLVLAVEAALDEDEQLEFWLLCDQTGYPRLDSISQIISAAEFGGSGEEEVVTQWLDSGSESEKSIKRRVLYKMLNSLERIRDHLVERGEEYPTLVSELVKLSADPLIAPYAFRRFV